MRESENQIEVYLTLSRRSLFTINKIERERERERKREYLDLLVLLDLLLSTTRVHGSQDLFQQLEHMDLIDLLLSTTSLCFRCRAVERERVSE